MRRTKRSGLLLNYTVHPDDVEMLAAQHTAFDPSHVNHVPRDDENDEGGFVDRSLSRWGDRFSPRSTDR